MASSPKASGSAARSRAALVGRGYNRVECQGPAPPRICATHTLSMQAPHITSWLSLQPQVGSGTLTTTLNAVWELLSPPPAPLPQAGKGFAEIHAACHPLLPSSMPCCLLHLKVWAWKWNPDRLVKVCLRAGPSGVAATFASSYRGNGSVHSAVGHPRSD